MSRFIPDRNPINVFLSRLSVQMKLAILFGLLAVALIGMVGYTLARLPA